MTLSNDILTIEVAERGAEMVSLRKDEQEFLWTGSAQYWNRHAPILFPAVGKPFNNEIHVGGKAFELRQHGFARDKDFRNLTSKRYNSIVMRMKSKPWSYPYFMSLEVCYTLKRNSVEAVWTVYNHSAADVYFQIGAHPGFLLPDYNPSDDVHGYIRYYDRDGNPVSPIVVNGLDGGNRIPLPEPRYIDSLMPITNDTFIHDALMFEGGQVAKAELWDKHNAAPVLSVSCQQADAYGIWAPHMEGCPFVCLEPWCGICDYKGFTGDISERQYIHRLPPRQKYIFTYTIVIF